MKTRNSFKITNRLPSLFVPNYLLSFSKKFVNLSTTVLCRYDSNLYFSKSCNRDTGDYDVTKPENSTLPSTKICKDKQSKVKLVIKIPSNLQLNREGSDLPKPVARHFSLPGHSHEHMEICGINLHFGNNETRKRKELRLIFKLGTLARTIFIRLITNIFLTNWMLLISTNGKT